MRRRALHRPRRALLAALGAAILFLSGEGPIPARAAPTGAAETRARLLVMPVSPARARNGEVYPIAVILQNGGQPLSGAIEAWIGEESDEPTARQAVRVGKGRFLFFLYPRPELPFHAEGRLHVRLRDASGRGVDATTLTLNLDRSLAWVGSLEASDRSLAGRTLRREGQIQVVNLGKPELLPDQWHGYRLFDALLWDVRCSAVLPPAQRQALVDWIRGGGRLVLLADEGDDRFQSPAPDAIPPRPVEGPSRVTSAGVWSREEPFGLGQVVFVRAHSLATDPGFRDALAGAVLGTATDFSEDPAIGHVPPFAEVLPYTFSTLQTVLARAAGFTVLDFYPILFTMLVYILLVSLGDYLILRRFRRLHWTWLTFSLLIAVFSIGAYVQFHQRNLGGQERHEIRLEDTGPDGWGRTVTLTVVRKNSSRPLTFAIPAGHDCARLAPNNRYGHYSRSTEPADGDRPPVRTLNLSGLQQVAIAGPVDSFQFFAESWIPAQPVRTFSIQPRPSPLPPRVTLADAGQKRPNSVYVLHRGLLYRTAYDPAAKEWTPAASPDSESILHKPHKGRRAADPISAQRPISYFPDYAAHQTVAGLDLLEAAERLVTDPANVISGLVDRRLRSWSEPDAEDSRSERVIVFAFHEETAEHHGVPSRRIRCVRQSCVLKPEENLP